MGWNSGMDFIECAAELAWNTSLSEEDKVDLMVDIIKKTIHEDCDVHAEYLGKYPGYNEAYKKCFGEDDAYKQYVLNK